MFGTPNKTEATNLIPGDKIAVNLAAMEGGPAGSRTNIVATFDHEGRQIGVDGLPVFGGRKLKLNGAGAAPPQFNMAQYMEIQRTQGAGAAGAYLAEHSRQVAAWEGGGNRRLVDQIGDAVLQFAQDEYGIRTDDGPWPVLKRSEVSVRPASRFNNQPTVFVVQAAPVWGM